MANETPSRPPLHGKCHLKFPFWFFAPFPNHIINQGAVLVIMSAILSTLTSVSLHYDHSPLALPVEVGHYPHLSSLVVEVLLFKVITKVKFWSLLYNRLPLYSFCTPFRTPFVFPLSKFSNLISIPFKVIFLILLYSLCCPIHYIKYSIHSYSFPFLLKILRCSIGLALVMVTGGWKASNIFSFSPSFLFVFFCWMASIIIQLSTFFMSSFCFGGRQAVSTFNFHFSFLLAFCFGDWRIFIIQISPFFFLLHILHTLRRAPSPPQLSQFGWDLPLPSQSPSPLLLRVQNKKRLDNRGELFQYKGEG